MVTSISILFVVFAVIGIALVVRKHRKSAEKRVNYLNSIEKAPVSEWDLSSTRYELETIQYNDYISMPEPQRTYKGKLPLISRQEAPPVRLEDFSSTLTASAIVADAYTPSEPSQDSFTGGGGSFGGGGSSGSWDSGSSSSDYSSSSSYDSGSSGGGFDSGSSGGFGSD